MKKIIKYFALFVAILFFMRICFSKEKKKLDELIMANHSDSVSVVISPDFTNPVLINKKIFGINIGYAFAEELDKDSGFVQLLRNLQPSSLRFPGGTVGNWYHPNLPVYGFKKEELQGTGANGLYALQSKRSENILYNLIRLCKLTNCGVVYCANLYFGNLEEISFVIDELKKNKIPIHGVELGNEFCLLGYRKAFPDGLAYIKKVKNIAIALRKKYPDLRIAAVAGDCVPESQMDIRSKFMRKWNQDVNKETFYDAYVWHIYQTDNMADKNLYFDSVFLKNNQSLAPIHNQDLKNVKNQFQKVYDTSKKAWITEWNVGNSTMFQNTFIQGAYVSEFFLSLLDLNTKYNNYYEISHLHALGGIITFMNGKTKALEFNSRQNTTYEYYSFKFLSTTLSENTYRCNEIFQDIPTTVAKQFSCYTFLNQDNKKVYLHFVNRSGKWINLKIKSKASVFYTESIDATYPYMVAGKVFFENDYPSKLKQATYHKKTYNSGNITIAPYAIGYIEYNKN